MWHAAPDSGYRPTTQLLAEGSIWNFEENQIVLHVGHRRLFGAEMVEEVLSLEDTRLQVDLKVVESVTNHLDFADTVQYILSKWAAMYFALATSFYSSAFRVFRLVFSLSRSLESKPKASLAKLPSF